MPITVTKAFSICYGHHLPEYDGKCANIHGHNSEIRVTVRKDPNRECYPDMVMDFGDIKQKAGEVINLLDHQNLNELLPDQYMPPTAENMALFLADRLSKPGVFGPYLVSVRVSETPTSWAEWRAESV